MSEEMAVASFNNKSTLTTQISSVTPMEFYNETSSIKSSLLSVWQNVLVNGTNTDRITTLEAMEYVTLPQRTDSTYLWDNGTVTGSNMTDNSTELYNVIKSNPGPPEWCLSFDLFNYGILIGLIALFGVTGNTLSAVTLWPKIKTNPTSFLLVTLAMLDNEILIFHFIAKGVPVICIYFGTCKFYMAFLETIIHVVGWYVTHICQMVTVGNIVLISFCRYIAMCKPHDTQKYTSMKRVKIMFVILILISIVLYTPRFGWYGIRYDKEGHKLVRYIQAFAQTTPFFVYNLISSYLLVYLIPFTFLVTMTSLQVRALKKFNQKRESMSKSKMDEHDITITLIVVVIVFMVCQLGEPIRRLSEMIPGPFTNCATLKYHAFSLKTFLTTLNSAINIVIYCLFGKKFRSDLMHRVFKRNAVHPASTVTIQVRSSYKATSKNTSEVQLNH